VGFGPLGTVVKTTWAVEGEAGSIMGVSPVAVFFLPHFPLCAGER